MKLDQTTNKSIGDTHYQICRFGAIRGMKLARRLAQALSPVLKDIDKVMELVGKHAAKSEDDKDDKDEKVETFSINPENIDLEDVDIVVQVISSLIDKMDDKTDDLIVDLCECVWIVPASDPNSSMRSQLTREIFDGHIADHYDHLMPLLVGVVSHNRFLEMVGFGKKLKAKVLK